MGHRTSRRERYVAVCEAAAAADAFSLQALKRACPEPSPAFVTRVVGLMVRAGLLERGGSKRRPHLRWRRCRESFEAGAWVDAAVGTPTLAHAPRQDRPRERLLARGAADLRIAELLAILIRSGRQGESALQAGEKVAARFAADLDRLPEAGRGQLRQISAAVSTVPWCQIQAGIELGRRVAEASARRAAPTEKIGGPADAVAFCRVHFARMAADDKQETLVVVCLDTRHRVQSEHAVSSGSLDGSSAHPREVFRPAIQDAAAAVILVHNHPSGDPTPSCEDLAVTQRLEEAGRQIGIHVLDHVIVAREGAVSLRQWTEGRGRR